MGRKATINRCLLYPVVPSNDDAFIVLGCHFGRTEAPFLYDSKLNKYFPFSEESLELDMYRSNDTVQFEQEFIYLRPFIKVGEPAEAVKVFKFYLQDSEEQSESSSVLENPETVFNGPDKPVSSIEAVIGS